MRSVEFLWADSEGGYYPAATRKPSAYASRGEIAATIAELVLFTATLAGRCGRASVRCQNCAWYRGRDLDGSTRHATSECRGTIRTASTMRSKARGPLAEPLTRPFRYWKEGSCHTTMKLTCWCEYSPRLYSVYQRFDEAGEHVLKAWNAGTLPQDGKLLIPIASVAA